MAVIAQRQVVGWGSSSGSVGAGAAVLLDLLTLLDAPLTSEEERELAELQDCSPIEIALRDAGRRRSGEDVA